MTKALFVTGHRPNKIPNGYDRNSPTRVNIRKSVETFILKAIEYGKIDSVITGMALGFDQDVCHAVLTLKQSGVSIELIAAVPFVGQEMLWKLEDQTIYKRMLKKCNQVIHVCDPGYAPWKMQKRNEWMVDNSVEGLALWNGENRGGTWNCISYAKSKGVRVFNLLGNNI